MERKYRIDVELDLQQVLQLRVIMGQLNNMTPLYLVTKGICDARLGADLQPPRYMGGKHNDWQLSCYKIVQESRRKVVVVGDKKYYEDELATALKSINAIGE